MSKENYVKKNKGKFNKDLVNEFMKDYNIKNEEEARIALAEYYHYHQM